MKTYSGASGSGKIRQMANLAKYKWRHRKHFAEVKFGSFLRVKDALEKHLGEPLTGKTILEIGCGQLLSNVKLLAGMGNSAIGVDPELPPRSLAQYAPFVRQVGWQRAIKTYLNTTLIGRQVDRQLEQLSGVRPVLEGVELFRVGGESVPIESEVVDAIISVDVFEHLENLDAVIAEMHRVLKPGGLAYIVIHPFASFSGAHRLELISHSGDRSQLENIEPWQHLRDPDAVRTPYLNKLREHAFRAAFENCLETLSWETVGPEGEEFLTPETEEALSDYPRAELLTGKIIYTGVKPSA